MKNTKYSKHLQITHWVAVKILTSFEEFEGKNLVKLIKIRNDQKKFTAAF